MTLKVPQSIKFFSKTLLAWLFLGGGLLMAQPTITSFSPRSAASGQNITVVGTGFSSTLSNNEVFVGSIKATITSASTTQLVFQVPNTVSGKNFVRYRNKSTGLGAQSRYPFVQTFSGGIATNGAISDQYPSASTSTVTGITSQSFDERMARGLASGDFNNDGSLDLAVYGNNASDVRVLTNKGAGGLINDAMFNTPVTYTVSGIQGLLSTPVDLNLDGLLDIVCFTSSGFSVLVNSTAVPGTFSKVDVAVSGGLYSGVAGDFNKDGRLDIVGMNGFFQNSIHFIFNTSTSGSTSFNSTVTTIQSTYNTLNLNATDLDNDGDLDLIYSHQYNSVNRGLSYRLNTSSTSFSFGPDVVVTLGLNKGNYSGGGQLVEVADFDTDGDMDIVTLATANGSNLCTLFRNDGSLSFVGSSLGSYTNSANLPFALHCEDFNGDGKTDVLIGTNNAGDVNAISLNTYTSGTLSGSNFTTFSNLPGTLGYGMGHGDFNGDGRIDLLANRYYSSTIQSWFSGTVTVSPSATVSVTSLSGFSSCAGSSSSNQSFTVSGTGLSTNALLITAPTGYEVSQSASSGYGTTLTLNPTSGSVSTTTVYVRSAPSAVVGSLNGSIDVSSNSVSLKTITLAGTVNALPTVNGTLSVFKNGTTALTGSATPAAVSPWTTSNASVATVAGASTTGTVTGVASGTASITYTNNVGCARTVSVSVFDPVITTSATSLTSVSACSGSASTSRNFTVSGVSIPTSISLSAPSGFEISLSSGSGYGSSLTLNATSGSVASTTIYARMGSAASGTPSGSISITSANATTNTVSISGTVNVAPTISGTTSVLVAGTTSLTGTGTPAISNSWATSSSVIASISSTTGSTVTVTGVSAGTSTITYTDASGCSATQVVSVVVPTITTSGTISAFTTCSGVASTSQSFNVSGTNLSADISISAPTGFEISLSSGSGYATSLTLAQSSGSVASTTVYVRVASTATGTPSGNISLTSSFATTKTVSVSATLQAGTTGTSFGNALHFNNGQSVATGTSSAMVAPMTVEAWVYCTGNYNIQTIVGNSPANLANDGFSFGINEWQTSSNKLLVETYNAVLVSTTTVPMNAWSHVAFVATTATQGALYINGVLAASGTIDLRSNSTQAITIGSMFGSYNFNGRIDDVRIWTTARSAAQITGSMNQELAGNESGLFAYYKFNQGTANGSNSAISTITDSGPNGRTGSMSGFAKVGTTSNFVEGPVVGSSTPTPITGTPSVCVGQTTTLANATTGGTWSSSNTAIATVNSSTGVVTGVAFGSATITYVYTGTNSCPVTVTETVTINDVPVASATGNNRCGAGTVNLTASATNGGTLAWYSVSTNGSSLATGSSYQPSVSVGTTSFYVEASNGCGSSVSRASAIATANALPDAPTVMSGQRCGTGTVALSATTDAGNTIRWYASGGTTVLATGTSYTTPSISTTTNYDVDVVSADGCSSATKSTAIATVSNTATWNSASSQSWTTAANWSCGTVPDGSLSLVISTGTATLSSDLSMASGTTLTLSSGAQLVIEPGHALTIQDGATFSNAGTVLVNANSSDYGQLLLQGTYTKVGSGKVQVKGYYDVDGNNSSPWVHVSSPVSGSLAQLGTVTTGNTQGWRASTASWIGMHTDSIFKAGKGYVTYIGTNGVASGPNGTFTMEGDPFNNITPRLDYNSGAGSSATFVDVNNRGGWNLLGNPFTCNLDYVALQTTIAGLNSSFARWNPKKGGPGQGGFDVHAPAGVGVMGTAVIPPMGAAWVQTSAASAPVASGTLKQKDHGRRNSRNFSKGTGVDKLLITVSELTSPQIQDEMTLAMVPGAVDGFDSEWDGRELLNSLYMPNIYSKFDQDIISAKAVDFNLDAVIAKSVPVGMASTQEMKPYRIHLDESWAQPGYTVYLKDHLLKNVHKLSTSDYVFAYSSWMEDRFELILTNAKTGALGLEEASRGALTAWVSGSELWITGLESGAQEIDVVGMDGRVVLSTALRGEEGQPATTALPELPAGLYTVRVRANGLERGVRFAPQR